jgi:hypothetical protein
MQILTDFKKKILVYIFPNITLREISLKKSIVFLFSKLTVLADKRSFINMIHKPNILYK